jgi:hypothetical protein
VGVGSGAQILYVMLTTHGTALSCAADFSVALATVAGISLLSVPFFLRMSPDAGAEVSGRAAPRVSAD